MSFNEIKKTFFNFYVKHLRLDENAIYYKHVAIRIYAKET